MKRIARMRGSAAILGLAVLASACAQEGDFGRRQPSAFDPLLTAIGDRAAQNRGEPSSGFMFTDEEARLRDRAYRFLMPAAPRPVFDALLANLRRSRILPSSPFPGIDDRPDAYVAQLLSDGPRSSHSPYRRLVDDMAADQALIGPLCSSVSEVAAGDTVRQQSLSYVSELPSGDRDRALARIAENRILVHWIGASLGRRLAAYRYGLHRLFVELPEPDGVSAERGLAALERQVTAESCFSDAAMAASGRTITGIGQDGVVYKP